MKMRDAIEIVKGSSTAPRLYHGTCPNNAQKLCQGGWEPHGGTMGGNAGQTRYLYLTTGPEDALWFAQEKGCDTVLEIVGVPMSALIVDPEDGIGDTVEDEINNRNGMPGKVALQVRLGPEHFSIYEGRFDL